MAGMLLVVIGTSLWMYFESRGFDYDKQDVKGLAAMNPVGWFFAGLFLWIVTFPVYLASRDKLRASGEARRARLTEEGRYAPKPRSLVGPLLVGTFAALLALFVAAVAAPGPSVQRAMDTDRAYAAAAPYQPAREEPKRDPRIISDGTYEVGTEIQPGVYRVGRYWERQDRNQETIQNDLTQGCPSIMVVRASDAYVKIQGEAIPAAISTMDPIASNCSDGSFLVGQDVAPGRYRLRGSSHVYWERMNRSLDTIANDLGSGQLIVVVRPSDFALKLSGVESMERIGN